MPAVDGTQEIYLEWPNNVLSKILRTKTLSYRYHLSEVEESEMRRLKTKVLYYTIDRVLRTSEGLSSIPSTPVD